MVVQPYTEPPTELAEVQESSESGWLRWCPTSMSLLRTAERRIFDYIETAFEAKYVSIPFTENKDCQIWTLTFNKESEKLPLVLIHGFASGVGLWCLNLDAFAADRPVYAIDLPGFGRSSRISFSNEALEAESQFVQSIEEWRKKMGLKKFILLGHSMGGFLASSYALQYPDQVSHLILADPWGFPDHPGKDDTNARIQIPFWVKGVAYLLQPFNPLWIVRAAGPLGPRLVQRARPDIVRKYSDTIKEADLIIPEYIYHCNAQKPTGESAFHAMMANYGWAKYPMIHRLPALRNDVPITFIYGARSWIDRKPGDCIKDLRTNSFVDVHILPGAGHHVYADRCEEFNSYVLKVSESADKAKQIHSVSDFQPKNSLNTEEIVDTTSITLQNSETVTTPASTSP